MTEPKFEQGEEQADDAQDAHVLQGGHPSYGVNPEEVGGPATERTNANGSEDGTREP